MSAFHNLQAPSSDPIFALAAEAKAAGPTAINATLGVYTDEAGKLAVFSSVQKAVKRLADTLPEQSLSYSGLLGVEGYKEAVHSIIFNNNQPLLASTATTGGTGALAINARLLKEMEPGITVVVPTPAWANHLPLLHAANVKVSTVPYLEQGIPSIGGIADALLSIKGPKAVLLQVSCHNPLGLDFASKQWEELASLMSEHEAIAFMDYAYQGFSKEPSLETQPLHTMNNAGVTTLFCWSAAKNHCIYGLRTGLAGCIVPSEPLQKTIEAYYGTIGRSLYSTAPSPGQWIVNLVHSNESKQWHEDLAQARGLLSRKRELLIQNLPDTFSVSLRGHGMFAMLPIEAEQIKDLRNEQKVFILNDGRTNIASVPENRIEEFCKKVLQVIEQ